MFERPTLKGGKRTQTEETACAEALRGKRKDTLFTRGVWKKGSRGGQPDWSVEDRPEWNRKGWESQRSLSRRA